MIFYAWESDLTVYHSSNSYPVHGLCILNDQDDILHIQNLYPEDDIDVHNDCIKLESYPEFTNRRLASVASSSTTVFDRFSHVYLVTDLESFHKRNKGVPKTIELSSSVEDMSRVLIR
jgi:hypothetical protein